MTDRPIIDTGFAEIARMERERERLAAEGLYDPAFEHDACGVGFVAAIDGKPRREVVEKGIAALKAVWHRGAVDADGKTGDGAGIHVEISQEFFKEHVARTGHEPLKGRLAVGQVFLPRTDFAAQEVCRTIVEQEVLKFGYYIYGWRQVPVNIDVLGEKANATRPEIEQILLANSKGVDEERFERDLFFIRRRVEKAAMAASIRDFYICSLSCRSIIYKGMFLAEHLSEFYPDLRDERFESRFAIFHQRYSTNTFPQWRLAQPFRMLAHNGEINTLKGNSNWMKSHEIPMASENFGVHAEDVKPIIQPGSSDSAALDAVFEVLVRAGRTAPLAKTLLVPEAWSKRVTVMPEAHRAMYAYSNSVMEPWDGPAALAATDGRWVIGGMDRNGLRPMRYAVTRDGLIVAGSEAGMVVLEENRVIEKGRLGPGRMIAVDLVEKKLYRDRAIKDKLAAEQPYEEWIQNVRELDSDIEAVREPRLFGKEDLRRRQVAAGLTLEDMELILHPMVEDAKEAVGSMGDDTPSAVLSKTYRPLSHFFRQNFSQVTNPAIDPLREHRVMSLKTRFGNLQNVLDESSAQVEIFTLESPVVSNGMFAKMREIMGEHVYEIDCTFAPADGDEALKDALDAIRADAEDAVRRGFQHIVLTDEKSGADRAPVPMILATGGVHSHLVAQGLRTFCSLNVRSGECLDPHYFAVLIGCGATTVNAYLAQECIADRHARGLFGDMSLEECVARFTEAVNQGLLKIMSKMGISVISSYRGGYNFEAVGLSRALVAEFFPGMPSRISGIGLAGIQHKVMEIHEKAYGTDAVPLPIGGFYRYRRGGESHALEANLIHLLQQAVTDESYSAYKKYSEAVHKQPPVALRDLLDFKPAGKAVPIDEVESITEIRKRFVTPGMSLGALSPEAHETLTIAMNRIGAKSDSGEGGEDPAHFKPKPNGDNASSAIKQVASGRFGVTAEYLNNCRELEIKIAQGAKPGEGGQLPGFKVTEMIARLRHSTPGVMLISPPPHHDIYSIEDLAQLIYDLKQINPKARVTVKLVAQSGVGTVAAGVAKAKADVILISGHSGGTGASPQTSIKFAGIPWELGLTEANQVLTLNNLRHRVLLRTDGGLKTGRDIVIAAMMGAEEYGVGTASLVAMGCIMVRQCHSNTCPVGVCTQDDALRKKFVGTPEKVVNLFTFIAEEVREILASLGLRSLNEAIGRTDLLAQVSRGAAHLDDLDLNPLLVQADPGGHARYCTLKPGERNEVVDTLDAQIVRDAAPLFEHGEKMELAYTVRNTHRAVGARTSSHITRKFGMRGLNPGHLTIRLRGSAGQSLGAFAVQGVKIEVKGDANDYVGKGLSGGMIVVRPVTESPLVAKDNTIIGNTVLYGATAGQLFAAGQAGERFAVRNSGAEVVIEGCGANGCEYMTGGTAVILGSVGDNFAAGMTGGMAFVHVTDEGFDERINPDSVIWQPVQSRHWEGVLRGLIETHVRETGSQLAREILAHWDLELPRFIQVCPKEMVNRLSHPLSDTAAAGAAE
ncbi:glutamate synthase large subunit [Futiania mangrovi]|uniref:Glutamate synthase [NADPH] large chain n=2 Tax=Futiania mangrovi TaxID=2959716 RepID=A0A9J6PAS0_9PROT|nr:glutamate synthase large subunit [Futiania mangrovii]